MAVNYSNRLSSLGVVHGQLCKTVLYRVEDERVIFEGYSD